MKRTFRNLAIALALGSFLHVGISEEHINVVDDLDIAVNDNMTSKQKEKLVQSSKHIFSMINVSIEALESLEEMDVNDLEDRSSFLVKTWNRSFGPGVDLNFILEQYKKLKEQLLDHNFIRFKPGKPEVCQSSKRGGQTAAYVITVTDPNTKKPIPIDVEHGTLVYDEFVIYSCSVIGDLEYIKNTGILFHELTHIALGTKDPAYVHEDHGKKFQQLSPSQKINAADAYSSFAEAVYKHHLSNPLT